VRNSQPVQRLIEHGRGEGVGPAPGIHYIATQKLEPCARRERIGGPIAQGIDVILAEEI
jgi:hypothetical protein